MHAIGVGYGVKEDSLLPLSGDKKRVFIVTGYDKTELMKVFKRFNEIMDSAVSSENKN